MVAVAAVVGVDQLEEVRLLLIDVSLHQPAWGLPVLLFDLLLNEAVEDLRVLLFDELVALLEAARKKADVLEVLAVEHFDYEFQHLLVKLFDIHRAVQACARHLVGNGTLPKVAEADGFLRLVVVLRHLLPIQAEKADVHLVFAAVKALPHLGEQVLLVAAVVDLELCAPW